MKQVVQLNKKMKNVSQKNIDVGNVSRKRVISSSFSLGSTRQIEKSKQADPL